MKITKERKQEILRLINQSLEAQFDIYTWANMINDTENLTDEEKEWAKNNTGYEAYIAKFEDGEFKLGE